MSSYFSVSKSDWEADLERLAGRQLESDTLTKEKVDERLPLHVPLYRISYIHDTGTDPQYSSCLLGKCREYTGNTKLDIMALDCRFICAAIDDRWP